MDTMQITESARKLVDDVQEGISDPIKAYIKLYELEKVIKEAKAEVTPAAMDKREQYPDKDFIQDGYKISVVSRKTYKYEDDAELDRLSSLIKARQLKMKHSYVASTKGVDYQDENGELIPPAIEKVSTSIRLEVQR